MGMLRAKITTVGNSIGIVLPKEATTKLRVQKGDVIYLCETKEGYSISPYDEAFIKQMSLAEKIMHDDRDVLKVLSKS